MITPAAPFESIRTLTFDCYGTLIDWESGILGALRPLVAGHGQHLSDDELLALYGELEPEIEHERFRPYRDVLREVVRRLGERLGFAPSADEVESLPESLADWPEFPDSVSALARLAERFELVVVSNVDADLFAASAARLGNPFRHVVTAGAVGAYKPSLKMFEAALATIDRPAEQILHCAQSLFHDIAPASAFGLRTVWVNRRAGKEGSGATPASEAVADHEVADLQGLASLLLG